MSDFIFEQLRQTDRQRTNQNPLPVILGDNDGNVPDPDVPGNVLVRTVVSQNLFVPFSVGAPSKQLNLKVGDPVELEVDRYGNLRIAGLDTGAAVANGYRPTTNLAITEKTKQQNMATLLPIPTDPPSKVVKLKGWNPIIDGVYTEFTGQIDLTSLIPSAGNQAWVVIAVDANFNAVADTSTPVPLSDFLDSEDAINEAITALGANVTYSWAILLKDNQATITQPDFDNGKDLRQVVNTYISSISGDVSGPGSSTDRAIATWNSTDGRTLRDNPTVTISSTGALNLLSTVATQTSGINFGNAADTYLYRGAANTIYIDRYLHINGPGEGLGLGQVQFGSNVDMQSNTANSGFTVAVDTNELVMSLLRRDAFAGTGGIAFIQAEALNASSASYVATKIQSVQTSNTAGAETAHIRISTRNAGTLAEKWYIQADGSLHAVGAAGSAVGSATTPYISRVSDPNTGIWFPNDDILAIANGGAESVRFDASQNVGIGATSIGARLQVNGAASSITSIFRANASSPGNITEWQNSSGTALTNVTGGGAILTSSYLRAGAVSAPNNTTAGDLTSVRLSVGNQAFSASGRTVLITSTSTATSAGAEVMTGIIQTITPASNSSTQFRGISFGNVANPGTGITLNQVWSGYFENRIRGDGAVTEVIGVNSLAVIIDASSAATATITTAIGVNASVYSRSGSTTVTLGTGIGFDTEDLLFGGGLTATTIMGFRMANPPVHTITSLIGMDIQALTRGSTDNIGLRIATPSGATNNYALQLSGTGGTAASGITFGTDVQLYRSGANLLALDDVLAVKQGTSTSFAKVGGAIFDHYADSSVGGAEADIYTDTLPANSFSANGDKVTASYGGNFVTLGTESVQLKAYLAGTAIWDSTGIVPTTGTTSWRVYIELIRVSSTVVRYTVSLNTTGASGFVYAISGELTGLTLSGTNILKITGTSSGVGSGAGDIVGKMSYVVWYPAA
jgi:hypothetical protein